MARGLLYRDVDTLLISDSYWYIMNMRYVMQCLLDDSEEK